MVEIKDQCGKVEVFKSYLKYIIFYKIYTLFFIALFSIITLKTINIFFNLLSVILIIGYIYISLFYISAEKIVIREDYLIIQALGNKEKVLYSKKIFLDEKKLILLKKDDCYIINIGTEIESDLEIFKDMNFEEIDFYVFYVNYLSKKEYENKKVLVGYNGIDGKEVTMSKLKEDINEVRDSRRTLKKS